MNDYNIALIGRPNVGKSTLFNRLIGRKKAIVSTIPGTTRDRIKGEIDINDEKIIITDVGGFSEDQLDEFSDHIREQIEFSLNDCDLIIMITDGNNGIAPTDKKVAQIVRNSNKKSILVVNKIDNSNKEQFVNEFYELGFNEIIGISAYHNLNIDLLIDKILTELPSKSKNELNQISTQIRLSIVGRPNTGKSTLFNKLHGSKRSITSNIPGTTRDSIDYDIVVSNQSYNIVDTPGIRRRGKIDNFIEKVSVSKAIDYISDSDVSILLIDTIEPATNQDAHIIKTVLQSTDGIIVAINKSDLIKSRNLNHEDIGKKVREEFKFLKDAPLIFISGLKGTKINDLINLCNQIYKKSKIIHDENELNNFIMSKVAQNLPKNKPNQTLHIYGVKQHQTYPNVFEFTVNNPNYVHFSYKRYIENVMREKFDYEGVIIKLFFRSRRKK